MSEQKKKSPPPCIPVSIFLYRRDTFWATRWIFNACPSLIRRKNKKKREKRGGKISLLFPLPSFFSLSLKEGSLSLSLEDALTPRRSIRDRGRWRCGRGVRVLVVCARALMRKSISSSPRRRRRRRLLERREFKRFFLSRDASDDDKRQKTKNKEIKRDFTPHRKRREPLLFFLCYSYSYSSCYDCCCICRCACLIGCCLQPRLRFAGIGARLSSSLFFMYYRFWGGQKFLSFSLSLSPKRQTDRHKLCDKNSMTEIHKRERGKGVMSASLLFSFFSRDVKVLRNSSRERNKARSESVVDVEPLDWILGFNTLNKILRTSPPSALENTSNVHTFEQHLT